MRSAGVGVPDVLNHRHITRLLDFCKTRQGRVPAHPARCRLQHLGYGNRNGFTKIVVLGRVERDERIQSIVAAVELNHDQHIAVGCVATVQAGRGHGRQELGYDQHAARRGTHYFEKTSAGSSHGKCVF